MMKTAFKSRRRKPAARLADGGNPVLNFINTCKQDSKGNPIDVLTSYSSFLNWCCDTKLIDYEQWSELDAEQYCYAHEASIIFSEVKTARTNIDEMFNNLARGEEVYPLWLQIFNGWAATAKQHLRYENTPNGPALHWFGIAEELNYPFWLIIMEACHLLDSGEWRKIKKCPVCHSLFIDNSRSHNRTWCNPSTCGSLKKSKRYYERKKVA